MSLQMNDTGWGIRSSLGSLAMGIALLMSSSGAYAVDAGRAVAAILVSANHGQGWLSPVGDSSSRELFSTTDLTTCQEAIPGESRVVFRLSKRL